jgi:serine/threonine protein kinase
MSDAEERNNKQPNGNGAGPTRSFDGSEAGLGRQIGPFRIERELGRGAVGVVYLAHDTKLDRSVAIKSRPAEVMENPKARSRFSREARLLASLNHPNIATIYEELQEAEGVAYLILEYVPGQTLAERIAGAKLQPNGALDFEILAVVCSTSIHHLDHSHLRTMLKRHSIGRHIITEENPIFVVAAAHGHSYNSKAHDLQPYESLT